MFPSSERFWLLGRKHHFTQQYELTLRKVSFASPICSNPLSVLKNIFKKMVKNLSFCFLQIDGSIPKNGNSYQVISTKALGEIDKSKVNFSLNFTSFIRSSSIGSLDLETPTKEDEESGIRLDRFFASLLMAIFFRPPVLLCSFIFSSY